MNLLKFDKQRQAFVANFDVVIWSDEDAKLGLIRELYAFTMNAPEAGQTIRIHAMGKDAGNLQSIKRVKLLGYKGKLQWKQVGDALEIVYPAKAKHHTSAVFRIEE